MFIIVLLLLLSQHVATFTREYQNTLLAYSHNNHTKKCNNKWSMHHAINAFFKLHKILLTHMYCIYSLIPHPRQWIVERERVVAWYSDAGLAWHKIRTESNDDQIRTEWNKRQKTPNNGDTRQSILGILYTIKYYRDDATIIDKPVVVTTMY